MPLRLEIISHQRVRLGERRVKEFGIKGGTIGRSLESDWALEDRQRYLSGRHAAIDYRSGSYYIVDTSTNGVYVNDSSMPIGRAKPQRLFHGDRLRLGEYVILVHLDESEADEFLDANSHVDPVERASKIESPTLTGYTLISEEELSALAVDEILEDDSATRALKDAAERAARDLRLVDADGDDRAIAPEPITLARDAGERREPEDPAARRSTQVSTEQSLQDQPGSLPTQTALYTFLRGAGLPSRDLDAKQTALLLHRAGQLVRELTMGLRRAIEVRVEHRNRLRLANTTIQPHGNNLLKFAVSAEEALENLFFLNKPEYVGAVDAVREAFDETIAHERALLEATRAALMEYLDDLDPDEIQQPSADGGKGGLLGGMAEAKFRQRYEALYALLAEHAPGQLPQRFTDQFAEAYEREIAASRSSGRPRKPRVERA